MAATVKKVRQTNDKNFTIRDLIDIYSGKKNMPNMINHLVNGTNSIKIFVRTRRQKNIPIK